MKRISLALFAAVMAFSFVGAQGAAAHETKPAVKSLLKTPLAGIAGKEANVDQSGECSFYAGDGGNGVIH